jgi:hypothetical protein
VISSQKEVGGWPSLAVNVRRLTVPANPHRTARSGYTVLEEWLQDYARTVERVPPLPTNIRLVVGATMATPISN